MAVPSFERREGFLLFFFYLVGILLFGGFVFWFSALFSGLSYNWGALGRAVSL